MHGSQRTFAVLGPIAVGLLLLLSLGPPAVALRVPASPPRAVVGPADLASSVPLDHIVVVVQENHVYDDYFGTYCTVLGPYCSVNATGIPPGTCVPLDPTNLTKGCVRPYLYAPANVTTPTDMVHDWPDGHAAYDNGSMDGFYLAEGKHLSTFGYYDGSLLPTYWDLAEQYATGDNMFASVLSYSTPNHWYLLAGDAPAEGYNQTLHKSGPNNTQLTANEESYLNEANATPTVADLLQNSSASWDYYDYPLANYTIALHQPAGAGAVDSAFDFWNPLAAKAESYNTSFSSHLVASSQFFADAKNGTLPNVSWVLPTFANSDHPPANLQNGEAWVSSVVNAVENSSDWNTSAIFVVWDDYGGYYDHQPPPQLDAAGVSFRSPFLVIGPYVRENYVSHHFEEFDSILHLIEWRYHLPSLTARDRFAPLPLEYFDFAAAPRPPMTVPGPLAAVYPEPLQGLGAPPAVTRLVARPDAGAVALSWNVPAHPAGFSAYALTYGPLANPNASSYRIDGNLTSVTISNLAPGTRYTFSLSSVVAANESASVTIQATAGFGAVYAAPSVVPSWEKLAPNGTGPSPRSGAAFAVDATDNVDVLFGGRAPNGTLLNDTWTFGDGRWALDPNPVAPSVRTLGAAGTDPSTGAVILFGGTGPTGDLADTWKFLGGRWTNLTGIVGTTHPSARDSAAIVGNTRNGGLLLFGGANGGTVFGDTWRFATGKWSRPSLGVSLPSPRAGAAFEFDPTTGYGILFGGRNATGGLLNDTWRYSGTAWNLVAGAGPPARAGASFAYDLRDQEGVLAGGTTSTGPAADLWSFSAGAWTRLHPPAPGPSARSGAGMVYDPLHQAVVLYGGSSSAGSPLTDLWAFSPPTSVRLTGSPTFLVAGGLVFFAPVVAGGFGPHTYLWAFGDGGRSTLYDGWHLFSAPGNYTVSLTTVDGGGVAVVAYLPVHVKDRTGRTRC